MRYAVVEGFNSLTRRFAPGAEVNETEIDGAVPLDRWVEMGKLKAVTESAAGVDLPTGQARLKAAWDTNRSSGAARPPGPWPIFIADHALYGEVATDHPDAAVITVTVPGEDAPRHYPRAAVDFENEIVSGDSVEPPAPAASAPPAEAPRLPASAAWSRASEPPVDHPAGDNP